MSTATHPTPASHDAAIVDALKRFAAIWPRKFAPATLADLLAVYRPGLANCHPDAIRDAATQLCSESQYPPKPADLTAVAKRLHRELFAAHQPPQYGAPADTPDSGKDLDRLDRMSRWAFGQLGTWDAVGKAWALVWADAPDAETRQAVRDGTLERTSFAAAVLKVQSGVAA